MNRADGDGAYFVKYTLLLNKVMKLTHGQQTKSTNNDTTMREITKRKRKMKKKNKWDMRLG